MSAPWIVYCPAGRHSVEGQGERDRRAQGRVYRESGCSACRSGPPIPCPPTAAELEAGLHIAPPVSGSDRLSGEPLTVEANRAMDRLRGGAPRPEGAP